MDQGVVRKTGTPDSLEKYRDDLVQLLGTAVKRIDDEKLMYPYVLIR